MRAGRPDRALIPCRGTWSTCRDRARAAPGGVFELEASGSAPALVVPKAPTAAPRYVAYMTFVLATFLIAAGRAGTAPLSLAERDRDAASARGLLSSRAETTEAGRLVLTTHDLLVVGVAYGFTDDLQATVTGLVPALDGSPRIGAVQARAVVLRRPRWTAAIRGVAAMVDLPSEDRAAVALGAGGLADLFLADSGWLSVHGALSAGTGAGQRLGNVVDLADGMALVGELGAAARVHPHVSFLAEISLPTGWSGDEADLSSLSYALVPYGVRWAGRRISLDAGFVKGLGDGFGGDPYRLGYPNLAVSAAFGPR